MNIDYEELISMYTKSVALPYTREEFLIGEVIEQHYEGQLFALFSRDGKLYEINDFHCSCDEFDSPSIEETFKDALLKRRDLSDTTLLFIKGLE